MSHTDHVADVLPLDDCIDCLRRRLSHLNSAILHLQALKGCQAAGGGDNGGHDGGGDNVVELPGVS